jgi:5-methylcytosine-specific restriction enzyme subunit McrC
LNIPIQNLFYLLCYAWDILPPDSLTESGIEDIDAWQDLLSFILIRGIERLLRRGLEREYINRSEATYSIRGKIRVMDSIPELIVRSGRLYCDFDELEQSTLINSILRSTLRTLHISEHVRHDLKDQLKEMDLRMNPIPVLRIRKSDFRRIRFHRNNLLYKFLLTICELVYDASCVNENGFSIQFQNYIRDEIKMRKLFEAFIRNFLRRELVNVFDVSSKAMQWDATSFDSEGSNVLPRMLTDVFLQNEKGIIIVECKYTPEVLKEHLAVERLRSPHLYQIYSYLQHANSLYRPRQLKGILLYPMVDRELSFNYKFPKFDLCVATVNLQSPWQEIHNHLLNLVNIL